MDISQGKNPACPACAQRTFDYLELHGAGGETEEFVSLCGRDMIQISPLHHRAVDLGLLAERFAPLGSVEQNRFLLRFHVDNHTLVFFADGRVLVQGTSEIAVARSLYAKYVGH